MLRKTLSILSLIPLLLAGCSQQGDPDTVSDTPRLVLAAELGNLAELEQLLQDSPTIDVRDSCQWTPLMKAALNGHLQAAERLLVAGAATDLGDKGGYTALMLAASNNHLDLVRLLLDYGADTNRREHTRGWTALIWSAKRGHYEVVKALIEAGADTRFLDNEHKSALDWAQQQQHPQVARFLAANPTS